MKRVFNTEAESAQKTEDGQIFLDETVGTRDATYRHQLQWLQCRAHTRTHTQTHTHIHTHTDDTKDPTSSSDWKLETVTPSVSVTAPIDDDDNDNDDDDEEHFGSVQALWGREGLGGRGLVARELSYSV